jgi:hypothetical protein
MEHNNLAATYSCIVLQRYGSLQGRVEAIDCATGGEEVGRLAVGQDGGVLGHYLMDNNSMPHFASCRVAP